MVKKENNQSAPTILEIVGLAGSGKTTILQSLAKRNNKYHRSCFSFKTIEYIPFLLESSPLLLRMFWSSYRNRNSRWITFHEIKLMMRLMTLHNVLDRKTLNGDLIVLNHDLVFMLTVIHGFVLKTIKDRNLEEWWNGMLRGTAFVLNKIIWLDAPDKILRERILNRDTRHRVNKISENDAYELFSLYRLSYEYIISRLTVINSQLEVMRFNTHEDSPDQIVGKIITVFDRGDNELKF